MKAAVSAQKALEGFDTETQGAVGSKLAIVSVVSGDFLNVSVALISEEKWGGSARSLRALFRPKYGKIQG